MSYRLLLFDLDGTLLDPQRRVHPRTERALRRLMAAGIWVGFATGRTHVSVAPYVATLQPNGPLILFNGAMVRERLEAPPLHHLTLPHGSTLAALELAAEYGFHVNLYVGDQILIAERTPTSRESEEKDGVPHEVVGELAPHFAGLDEPATKIMMIDEAARFDELDRRFAERDAAGCTRVRSEPTYLEILPPGTNKGAGLPPIATGVGIPPSEVIAFGDNLNDVELLGVAGLGVAMGNGHPELIAIADRVIGPHDSDAIGAFIDTELELTDGRLTLVTEPSVDG